MKLGAFAGFITETCVSGLFLDISLLLPSSPASSPEPGDVLPGPASYHPAASADCAGPASANTSCQRHHPDINASHSPDGRCTAGPASSSK